MRARADAGDDTARWQLADLLAERAYTEELQARADAGDIRSADRLLDLLARQGYLDKLWDEVDAGGLLGCAHAAGVARTTWLHTARAWYRITTDTRGTIAHDAAETAGLALWAGRLAYTDPASTPALGPSHTPRTPQALAPESRDLPAVVAAVHQAFKTVVAFANGDGGTIAFGVSDDGRISGLPEKVQASRARLNDLIRDLISRTPRFRIESHSRGGRNVLLLKISENDGSVYGLILDANKPEYYVRRDGTTYYARPDKIESIVQRGVLQQGYPAWAGGG